MTTQPINSRNQFDFRPDRVLMYDPETVLARIKTTDVRPLINFAKELICTASFRFICPSVFRTEKDVRAAVVLARCGESKYGPCAGNALIKALKELKGDEKIRKIAAEALGTIEAIGWIKDSKVVPALTMPLSSDIPAFFRMIEDNKCPAYLREAVVEKLGQSKSLHVVPVLVMALKDSHWQVRATAAWALGEIKDPRSVPALSVVLKDDSDKIVRDAAAAALRKFNDPRAKAAGN